MQVGNRVGHQWKKVYRPQSGDLVVVSSANDKVNAYRVNPNFSFADVAGTVNRGDMGIVLDLASSDNGSILFHYVKVLFASGLVGIVHYGLLCVMSLYAEEGEGDLDEKFELRVKNSVCRM